MANPKLGRLRRLERVTRLLYKMEIAKLASLSIAVSDALERAEAAEHYLDADASSSLFLTELTLTRAGRMRRELEEAKVRKEAQIEVATEALAKSTGAECGASAAELAAERTATASLLNEIIDSGVRSKSRLTQV